MRERMAQGPATDEQLVAAAVKAIGGDANTAEIVALMVLRSITPTGAI
jgi:hypothetical protein